FVRVPRSRAQRGRRALRDRTRFLHRQDPEPQLALVGCRFPLQSCRLPPAETCSIEGIPYCGHYTLRCAGPGTSRADFPSFRPPICEPASLTPSVLRSSGLCRTAKSTERHCVGVARHREPYGRDCCAALRTPPRLHRIAFRLRTCVP